MRRNPRLAWLPAIGLAVASLLAGTLGAQNASTQPAASGKPNIILIIADDLGFADLGFQGCKDIPTPNIDALAKSGVRFTNAYASAPVCAPSRAGLITGRYQQRFGFEFNPDGDDMAELRTIQWPSPTLPETLKLSGYATGLIGKWHLGPLPGEGPHKRGFEEFFGFYVKPRGAGPDGEPQVWRNKGRVDEPEDITSALAREAVDFISRHKDSPFFLQLNFSAPHLHVQPPPALLEQFQSIEDPLRRTYAANVSAMDIAVGRVLAALKDSRREQNTIVVFLSDNGGPTAHNSSINGSRNAPLRGSKEQLFEGGIHVPMVMAWPERIRPGSSCAHPVIHLDLMSTFLAAAGIELDPQWKLDGVDLLLYLDGASPGLPHDLLFWRSGDAWAVRRGQWKLVKGDADTGTALFNLTRDLGETNDLSSARPEIVQQLTDAWRTWNSKLQPPAWSFKSGATTTPE